MTIGKLDQRLTIQDYTAVKNASGEFIRTYADLITVWAGVDFTGGGEDFEADQKVATNVVTFKVRFTTVAEDYRIIYKTDEYDILHIGGDYRTRYLLIKAKKRNNA